MQTISPLETTEPSRWKLLLIQGALALGLAVFLGALSVIQMTFGLRDFGGMEYVPRVVTLSAVRTLGGGISATAVLYALLVWTHRFPTDEIKSNLVRAAPATTGLAIVSLPFAIALSLVSSYLASTWIYGVPWDQSTLPDDLLTGSDFGAAAISFMFSMAVVRAFAWFALPFMCRRSWSLFQKLGATLAGFALLRFLSPLVVGH